MIISHKYKFIFFKTGKTAGTSIEISLSRYCGDDDIITPISNEDEKIRSDLGIGPQNYKINSEKNIKYYNHITAQKVINILGKNKFDEYVKFCFERNPFDRAISWYFYQKNRKGSSNLLDSESFDSWLNQEYTRSKGNNNSHIYKIDNKIAVDYIGRYEALKNDLAEICNFIGIPYDGWLPKAKSRFRKNRRPYTQIFNFNQRNIIENHNSDVIALMAYDFNNPNQHKPYLGKRLLRKNTLSKNSRISNRLKQSRLRLLEIQKELQIGS